MAPRIPADEPTLVARWTGHDRQNVHGVPARDLTTDDCSPADARRLARDYPALYALPDAPEPKPAAAPPAPRNEVSA